MATVCCCDAGDAELALAGTRRPERKREKEKGKERGGKKEGRRGRGGGNGKGERKEGRRERKRERSKIILIKRTLKSSAKFLVMFPSSTMPFMCL